MSFEITNLTCSPGPYITDQNITFSWGYTSNTANGVQNQISIYALFESDRSNPIFVVVGINASEGNYTTTINSTFFKPGKWLFNIERVTTDNINDVAASDTISIQPFSDLMSSTTQQSTATSSTYLATTNTPSQQPSTQYSKNNNAAVIAGSIVGAVGFVAILIALLGYWRCRRSRHADNSAKEMTDMSFAGGRSSYHNVPADASNDLLLRIHDPDLREKYVDTAPHSPESPVPINPPKPYAPQLHGPAESTPTTILAARNQPSSQLYYVPAIAGPGGASTVAPASHDPYGDSKTQEDE